MNLGNWDRASLKAVLLASLIVPVYAAVEVGIPHSLDEFAGLGMFFLLFYSVYLLFSVIGWACIGFPAHWIICKFGDGRLAWYLLVASLFSVVTFFIFQIEAAVVYGVAALLQVLLFKHYVYKSAKT